MSHFPGTEDFGGSDYPDAEQMVPTIRVKKEPRKEYAPEVTFADLRHVGRVLRDNAGMVDGPLASGEDNPLGVSKNPSRETFFPKPTPVSLLPTGYAERKKIPIASGVLDYFPAALLAVAEVSEKGNAQHNPGEEIHWARGKSMNQVDTLIRHFLERGTFDTDGVRHSAKMAWRALALLQLELEAAGAPMARGAR